MTDQNWYESFFEDAYLDVQRQVWPDEETKKQAEFIRNVFELEAGAKILDVPCGNGRLTLPLAEAGYDMTGVDFTEPLLNDARRAARERSLDITWEKRDMRQLPWKEQFDAAICMGGSFGYFDDNGNMEHLKAICAAVKMGGKFMMDLHIAETLLPKYEKRNWLKIGDIYVLDERGYDLENSRITSKWTFVKDGRISSRESSVRIYTYRQLCRLLRCVGFGGYKAYANIKGDEFKFGSPRLFMSAVKIGLK